MNRRHFIKISLGLIGALAISQKILIQRLSKQLFLIRKKKAIIETYINTMKSLIEIKKLNYPEWIKEMWSYQVVAMCKNRVFMIQCTRYE